MVVAVCLYNVYRPACRINHTGVRSNFSPLYARTKMSASALLGGAVNTER